MNLVTEYCVFRSELAQYQRRFVELYGQMDNTQAETQQFFDMFNNLGQQRSAIEKEIQLMNSIQESFVSISTQKHKSDKFEVVINHENESKQEQNPKIIPVSVHFSVQIRLWIHFWIWFMFGFVFVILIERIYKKILFCCSLCHSWRVY